jgi:hypothetical protein
VSALLLLAALSATPEQWALDYRHGPKPCPSAGEFTELVAAQMGRVPFHPAAKRKLKVQYREKKGDLQASFHLQGRGQRELWGKATDCRALAEGLAMALALAIEPEGKAPTVATAASPPPSPRKPPPSPPPKTNPLPVPTPTSSISAQAPSPPLRLPPGHLYLSPTLSFGGGPALFTPGFLVGGQLLKGHWSVGLEFGMQSSRATTPSGAADLTTQTARTSLVGCGHLSRFAACGVVSAGAVVAWGDRFTTNRQSTVPWLAAAPRLQVELLRAPLWLAGYAEAPYTLVRTRLVTDDARLWTTPRWSLGLGLNAGLAF